MNTVLPIPAQTAGPDIVRLVKGVARRWPIVLVMVLLGLLTGYGAKNWIVPSFTSTVLILLDPKRPGSYGADGQFANLYVDNAKVGSVVSIIQSPEVLSRVVDAERLADDPQFGGPLNSRLTALLTFMGAHNTTVGTDTPELRRERALARLMRAVRASREGFTYVIKVQVTAYDAVLARRLAAAVSDAYLKDQVRMKVEALQRDSAWLTEQLRELRNALLDGEARVEGVRREYGIIAVGPGQEITADRQSLTQLSAQLALAEGDLAARRAKWEQVEKIRQNQGDLAALPELTASRTMEDLRRAQIEAARRISELNARYTSSYAERDSLERDKRALDAQMKVEISRIVASIRHDYETAISRRDELKQLIATLTDRDHASVMAKGRVELREATLTAESNRAFYDAQRHRLQEMEQLSTRETVEARIIAPASAAVPPSVPPALLVMGASTGAGLLGGVGLALIAVLREGRFVNGAWVEKELGLQALGIVPLLRGRDLVIGDRRVSIVRYLITKPTSAFAESMRLLRANLRYAGSEAPRTVQVTSAVPGEGKSTVAAALAVSAAAAGLRTVLVDLDIRNASLSEIFELEPADGVSDVLQGRAIIGAALQTPGSLPLAVVGAGMVARHRPDIIETPHLEAMTRELAARFDLVILDSPPSLAASDTVLIARVADATLLVIGSTTTPREIVRQAVKTLRSGRAPIVGVVMNKASPVSAKGYGRTAYGAY